MNLEGQRITLPELGPAPCDRCRHRARCAVTGEACLAFATFYDGKDWGLMPTEPRVDVGRRLGMLLTAVA